MTRATGRMLTMVERAQLVHCQLVRRLACGCEVALYTTAAGRAADHRREPGGLLPPPRAPGRFRHRRCSGQPRVRGAVDRGGRVMAAASLSGHVRATCAASMLMAAVACPALAQTSPDEVELSLVSPRAERVASQVARSVVQVVATAYGTDQASGVLNMQRLVGAGTIVDEAGYILTSASLVDEAMQVDVMLAGNASDPRRSGDAAAASGARGHRRGPRSRGAARRRQRPAGPCAGAAARPPGRPHHHGAARRVGHAWRGAGHRARDGRARAGGFAGAVPRDGCAAGRGRCPGRQHGR